MGKRKLIDYKFKVGDIVSVEYAFDHNGIGIITNIGSSYEGITVKYFDSNIEIDYNHSHAINFFKVL